MDRIHLCERCDPSSILGWPKWCFIFLYENFMTTKKNVISQEGYEKIIAEIALLKEEQIPETLEVLKDARSQWDLSENSDYHAAKEKLALLQRRISELEDMIERVEIIQEDEKKSGKNFVVKYWSKVTLEIEWDKEFTIEIVWGGEVEVWEDIAISLDSPLWQAIEGKKKWEKWEIKLPSGNKKVTILSVS